MLISWERGAALLASLLLSAEVLQSARARPVPCSTGRAPAAVLGHRRPGCSAAPDRHALDDASVLVQISQEQSQELPAGLQRDGAEVRPDAPAGGAARAPAALLQAGARSGSAHRLDPEDEPIPELPSPEEEPAEFARVKSARLKRSEGEKPLAELPGPEGPPGREQPVSELLPERLVKLGLEKPRRQAPDPEMPDEQPVPEQLGRQGLVTEQSGPEEPDQGLEPDPGLERLQLGLEQPGREQPGGEQPGGEQPGREQPVPAQPDPDQQPGSEQPSPEELGRALAQLPSPERQPGRFHYPSVPSVRVVPVLAAAAAVLSLVGLAACTCCWFLHRHWEQEQLARDAEVRARAFEVRSRAEELRARAAELRARASEVLASSSVDAPGVDPAAGVGSTASEEFKADTGTLIGVCFQALAPLAPVLPVVVLGSLAAGLCESKESAIRLSSFDVVDTRAASEASVWGRIVSTVTYTAVQVFLGPALGAASDSWGRRPVILACKALAALQTLAAALHVYYEFSLYPAFALEPLADLPVTTLLIVWAIDRLGGSRLRLATGLGLLFGIKHFFQFAGLMSGFAMTLQQAFTAMLAADLLCVAMVWLALPESLPEEIRRPLEWHLMLPGVGMRCLHRSRELAWLTVVAVLATVSDEGFEAEARRHLKRDFQWDDTAMSVGLVIFQGSAVLWLACGLAPLAWRFGEVGALIFARWASLLYAVCFLLATEAWQIWFLDATMQGPAALTFPAMVLLCSTLSAPVWQGVAQGSLHAVVSLSQSVGPALLLRVFRPDTSSETSSSNLNLFIIILVAAPGLLVLANMRASQGHKSGTHADSVKDGVNDNPRSSQEAAICYIRQAAAKTGHDVA